MALSYGRIAKIAAQLSNGLVNSAMGQIPCSTERISSFQNKSQQLFYLLGSFPLKTESQILPLRLFYTRERFFPFHLPLSPPGGRQHILNRSVHIVNQPFTCSWDVDVNGRVLHVLRFFWILHEFCVDLSSILFWIGIVEIAKDNILILD